MLIPLHKYYDNDGSIEAENGVGQSSSLEQQCGQLQNAQPKRRLNFEPGKRLATHRLVDRSPDSSANVSVEQAEAKPNKIGHIDEDAGPTVTLGTSGFNTTRHRKQF